MGMCSGLAGFALGLLACSTSTPVDAPLGQATLRVHGTAKPITAAWAEFGYEFFGNANDSYGTYIVNFTADVGADAVTCNERSVLASISKIIINTTQVYHGVPGPHPVLPLGDIPVVSDAPTATAPSSTIVTMQLADVISVTGGTMTITAFDSESIQATYSATGSTNADGDLIVPICPPQPVN